MEGKSTTTSKILTIYSVNLVTSLQHCDIPPQFCKINLFKLSNHSSASDSSYASSSVFNPPLDQIHHWNHRLIFIHLSPIHHPRQRSLHPHLRSNSHRWRRTESRDSDCQHPDQQHYRVAYRAYYASIVALRYSHIRTDLSSQPVTNSNGTTGFHAISVIPSRNPPTKNTWRQKNVHIARIPTAELYRRHLSLLKGDPRLTAWIGNIRTMEEPDPILWSGFSECRSQKYR